jgi:hypothetical protein
LFIFDETFFMEETLVHFDKPVDLNLNLREGSVIPVCIKLCEPICAESNYKVSLNLMGQPFIEIVVQGITRLFNCRDKGTSTGANPENVVLK